MPKRTPEMLAEALAGSRPLTLDQLRAALADASPATTFRYLRQVDYLRSYNHNGRFYTLADPQRFDHYGLLSLGPARFSRDRTLTATVPRLVREADAGWTSKEPQSLLHVQVRSFLISALRQSLIRRERIHGVFVYLSRDPSVSDRQRQARQHRMALASDPDPAVVIEVLLAVIRSPSASPVQLARHLQGHSPPVGLSDITAVFARYDLHRVVENGGPAGC